MSNFKIQFSAMIVVVYFIILSIREGSIRRNLSCSKIYDVLLIVAPWAVLFDGITAWTVNHLDMVSEGINKILHLLFFVSMEVVVLCMMLYLVDVTIGLTSKKRIIITLIPAIAAIVGIIVFINQLYFVNGKTTNYSMGISVVIGYSVIIVYFLAGLVVLLTHRHMVGHRKKISVYSFMAIILLLLSIQVLFPETLITSLLPPICVVMLYENFENPIEKELKLYNTGMINGFSTLVESRDDSTGGHIHRTQGYVEILLKNMRKHSKYRQVLNIDYLTNIVKAAPMHDIGKISTPDEILQKKGKLTAEEYEIMKDHAAIGGDIILKTFSTVDDKEFLEIAYDVARFHHERWDGNGYPQGLKGEAIPLHARVMAIADVFDAVSAKRCYRDALPLEECFKIIEEGKGGQFDPTIAAIFLEAKADVVEFFENNKDSNE